MTIWSIRNDTNQLTTVTQSICVLYVLHLNPHPYQYTTTNGIYNNLQSTSFIRKFLVIFPSQHFQILVFTFMCKNFYRSLFKRNVLKLSLLNLSVYFYCPACCHSHAHTQLETKRVKYTFSLKGFSAHTMYAYIYALFTQPTQFLICTKKKFLRYKFLSNNSKFRHKNVGT